MLNRRIQGARHDAGFATAQEFADALGMSLAAVRSWERARNPITPELNTLTRIAEITGKPVAYFLDGEQQPELALVDELRQTRRRLERMEDAIAGNPTEGDQRAPEHPGVETLARNEELMADAGVTRAELEDLRGLFVRTGSGQVVVISSLMESLEWLRALRASVPSQSRSRARDGVAAAAKERAAGPRRKS